MNEPACPTSSAASTPRPRDSWLAIGLTAAIILYGIVYLLWFLQTPLGRAPQLDSAENLFLAGQIAHGTLAPEPFYRAMLYPATLAIPLKLGLHANVMPAFASLLGLLCHFIITLGVARVAARVWPGPQAVNAGLLAAALWGLNPVALFYALDALDTIPSLALAVWALVWWARPGARKHDAWVGGVLLGLAVAARPHFLPVVFIAPVLRSWLAGRWRLQRADVMAWAGAVAVLLVLGGVQQYRSGQFTILPTQGPYNFYAANRPGANGRFYSQQMFFTDLTSGENPARMESNILYAKATGKVPPDDLAEMNAYWREQAWLNIKDNPGDWFKLLAKKTYYLFNDFDQYNNKTYAWHQAESPPLRWNFLSWGILLVLTAGILALRGRGQGTLNADFNCPMIAALALVFCTYMAGALLYYASGRFRLPLAPLLCVYAGGWMTWPGWAIVQRSKIIAASIVMPLAGFLAFSNFYDARDQSTFIQDEMLAANAAAQVGDDSAAVQLAARVLARDPNRADARRILIISNFNFSLSTGQDSLASWKRAAEHLQGFKINDDTLSFCAGVTYWKVGDKEKAVQIWRQGTDRFGSGSASAQALAAASNLGTFNETPSTSANPQLVEFLKKKPL